MKIRTKIIAAVLAVGKPIILPLLAWYGKRKMRKDMKQMQEDFNGR